MTDPNNAEDAFQATLLILARRGASGGIGRPEALGPWLHGVASHIAREADPVAARRRRHEGGSAVRITFDAEDRDDLGLSSAMKSMVYRGPEGTCGPLLPRGDDLPGSGPAARCIGRHDPGAAGRARELLRLRLARQEGAFIAGRTGRFAVAAGHEPASVPSALIGATTRAAMTLAPGGVGSVGISASSPS